MDLPLKQLDLSSQELLGIVSAAANDTACTSGLAPQNGSDGELCKEVDPCQGSSLSFLNRVHVSNF